MLMRQLLRHISVAGCIQHTAFSVSQQIERLTKYQMRWTKKSVTVIRKMRETDLSSCKAQHSILMGAVTQITDFLGHDGHFESDCVSLICRNHICVLHWKCNPMFVMILSKSRTSGLYCTTLCTYKVMPYAFLWHGSSPNHTKVS